MSKYVITLRGFGRLRGFEEKTVDGFGYVSFKGIPYAQPPVGKLRFKDPVPVEPQTGIRDASHLGPSCTQYDYATREIHGSDDCLYLNVYVPRINEDPTSPKLPVMVWLHGGGFVQGSGDNFLYGPDYLIRKEIILITINYRLGVLGFLNMEHESAPGNQGLKDQILALRWVKQHVESFGGDSNNVTIFGESAGAASVHYLAISPTTKGLFHKAIAQSGCGYCPWANIIQDPKSYATALLKSFGKASMDVPESVEFLQSIDSVELVKAQNKLQNMQDRTRVVFPFGPGRDDASSTPCLPNLESLLQHSCVEVPFILGYNDAEGIALLKGIGNKACEEINKDFDWILHPQTIRKMKSDKKVTTEQVKRAYFGPEMIDHEKQDSAFVELLTDMHFVNAIQDLAKQQANMSPHPTYLYRFSFRDEQSLLKLLTQTTHVPGACHADELAFLFYPRGLEMMGYEAPKSGSNKRILVERMIELWTQFAKTGNPTTTGSAMVPLIWKPVKTSNELHCLEINDELRMSLNPDAKRRIIWDRPPNKL